MRFCARNGIASKNRKDLLQVLYRDMLSTTDIGNKKNDG
jgi:hypothetical protein